jgi:hypothetical protein
MKAFGNLMPFDYVICMNHSIHLAVVEVFFPKKRSPASTEPEEYCDEGDESYADEDNDQEDDDDIDNVFDEIHQPLETFQSSIKRMRDIIKFFRSPLRKDFLHQTLKDQGEKVLDTILFNNTRWNSLVISSKRFLLLLPGILHTLRKTVKSSLPWTDENTKLIQVSSLLNQDLKMISISFARELLCCSNSHHFIFSYKPFKHLHVFVPQMP